MRWCIQIVTVRMALVMNGLVVWFFPTTLKREVDRHSASTFEITSTGVNSSRVCLMISSNMLRGSVRLPIYKWEKYILMSSNPFISFCLNSKHMRTCLSTQQRAAFSHISIIIAKKFEKCLLTCSRTLLTVCAMHKACSWQFFLGCSEKTVFKRLYNDW